MCQYYQIVHYNCDFDELCIKKWNKEKDDYGNCYFSADETACDIYNLED
jgi:hypothetical protein